MTKQNNAMRPHAVYAFFLFLSLLEQGSAFSTFSSTRFRGRRILQEPVRISSTLLSSELPNDANKIASPSSRILSDLNVNGVKHTKLDADSVDKTTSTQPVLNEVDVLYNRSSELVYDPSLERYVKRVMPSHTLLSRRWNVLRYVRNTVAPRLSVAFLPSGVTPNYYRFMRWRVIQRLVSANLQVFGTQSLLMGLGLKSSASQLAALSAALKWVLKDALGKLVRMTWASRMGRRFDSDAKRWRFRSAFVFALGNGLEIVTYIIPSMFLVWATLANCCKQMSMLTSSSTRTAIYNSFRDGTRENIGDITAKGEAQIAIVDLLGIACGVTLSRTVGTSIRSVLMVYFSLQALEIMCMYKQLRTVVYRVLNFERMVDVIQDFVDSLEEQPINGVASSTVEVSLQHGDQTRTNPSHHLMLVNTTSTVGHHAQTNLNGAAHPENSRPTLLPSTSAPIAIKTPQQMAATERLFLPPRHLARRSTAFGSMGRAKLSPSELEDLLKIFAKERFILVVGANVKCPDERRRRRMSVREQLRENCHIVLHKEATNVDIVKSTLALTLLRQRLVASGLDPMKVRSGSCKDMLIDTLRDTDRLFGLFRKQLFRQGWESPTRSLFGRVHMRAEWPSAESRPKTDRRIR